MEQYPDADGPHFLFTAVPTLFLAPATPPERGHTASIAARVARFFRGGDVQLWSYADDTYLVGPPDRVLHHFTGVVRRLGGLGLAVQPHKMSL
ncbi:hypothetical protein CLOM_g6179 [Closterium sp. NIES-68]|nr:hypothetical protein CLOM_g6179 [Closterium sp. NIES-68]